MIKQKNSIKTTIVETNEFIDDLKEEVNEYANNKDCCPKCGEQLEYKRLKEKREYQGCSCYEFLHEPRCPNGCQID